MRNSSPDNPWDQLEGETDLSYDRFRMYLLMGPSRTIIGLCKRLSINRSRVYQLVDKHNWKERVRAWDTRNHEDEEQIFKEERIKWRIKRFRLLDELDEILERSIDEVKERMIDGKDVGVNLSQINRLSQMLLSETRAEFGDKKPSTQINVDARQLKIERIEVIKDYGDDVKKLTDSEVIEGEVVDA